ncbi:XkdF-like putative serine protease domain-containing protein [Hominenteromicrobium sp.]|jgi:hypothetical protein|uniref:XkdF-like putative serine protease domain-containing protein n=1 Tax=Hominenteromicrobium sp. TaxID=3073581 RepID=UPI003AF1A124
MSKTIEKAYAISDAKISFVSLVDKAANKKQFLITKAEAGSASFASYGRIVNADAESHYITGIVYEPMTEDAHGNYMTEEEITKAAYWFAKNGNQVDLQHSFEPLEDAAVVESYVAKCDMEINGQSIKKGTWLMTVEVNDPDVFEAIKKGEITGFSMGGVGKYSSEDVALDDVAKTAIPTTPADREKRGLFKRLAAALGFEVVEKGEMADRYAADMKYSGFWNAFYTLEDVLYRYNWQMDRYEFEDNENLITEALTEFNAIVTDLLTGGQPVAKALASGSVFKAGKAMSNANKETLTSIYDSLGAFLEKFNDEQEETDVTKKEITDAIAEGVAKALAPAQQPEAVEKAAENTPITAETIEKMVDAAVKKALAPAEDDEEPVTAENIQKMIEAAVEKAVAPVRKAAGVPSNLNDEDDGEDGVEKAAPHYLAGIL